jgi:hypothetical protein
MGDFLVWGVKRRFLPFSPYRLNTAIHTEACHMTPRETVQHRYRERILCF